MKSLKKKTTIVKENGAGVKPTHSGELSLAFSPSSDEGGLEADILKEVTKRVQRSEEQNEPDTRKEYLGEKKKPEARASVKVCQNSVVKERNEKKKPRSRALKDR